eukprot:scaffold2955_cov203-Chaetoceros_neogracile.AAC.2
MPPKKKEPKSTKEPPIEGTAAEYQELLQIAASLDAQDARSELIESARYGELDCVKALLQIWTSKINEFIDTTDSNGATALHKAAASGHDSTWKKYSPSLGCGEWA